MRDHYHHSPADTGFCEHCGQPLPIAGVVSYGERKPVNRTGIAITVALHVILLLAFMFQKREEQKKAAPPEGNITYVSPLPGKPKPKQAAAAPQKHQQANKPTPTPPVLVKRLPNTITLPDEKPVKVKPEPPKPKAAPPEMDMAAAIEARRRARGQDSSDQPAQESDADRGMRIAKANIAAANGRSQGQDPGENDALFSVENQTFASAELKLRIWNNNFKRRWLTQVTVERGGEPDIETAIVKKVIELIRKNAAPDFKYHSRVLRKEVMLSSRPADQAELEAFLFKEMFPEYKRGPGGR